MQRDCAYLLVEMNKQELFETVLNHNYIYYIFYSVNKILLQAVRTKNSIYQLYI